MEDKYTRDKSQKDEIYLYFCVHSENWSQNMKKLQRALVQDFTMENVRTSTRKKRKLTS